MDKNTVDFRYHTNDDARDFHKNRKAFIIYKNKLEFLPFGSSMSHFEFCQTKGIEKAEFNSLTRGYFLSGNLVFYKDNFVYDEELIKFSLNYLNEISSIIGENEFDIYYGQIPEENFRLDLFYGKYKNGVVIRKANISDAEKYVDLNNLVWKDAYKHIFPEEIFLEREKMKSVKMEQFCDYTKSPEHIVYVAEKDGELVGLILAGTSSFYPYYAERGYADLMAIYVHPDYQGFGIASSLKKIFDKWLEDKGKTKFVIGVLKDNLKARKVYEKWGGVLDEREEPFQMLGKDYSEVFYLYNINTRN